MKKTIKIFLGVGMLTLLISACSMSNNDDAEITPENAIYENYESGFNYTSRRQLRVDEVPEEVRDFELEKSEDYDVTYEKVTATGSYDDLCTMGVNNDILYPGALVDTSSDSFRPITIKRAPITLSTNLESVLEQDAPISTVIESPSLSSVRQGIRQIVSNNIKTTTNLPANMSYSIKEITNEAEFKLNVGFGLQIKKFDLSENFSYGNLKKQTNLLFVLKQVYYTIDMDTPTEKNSRDLFADSLTNKQINDSLKGTIPAYVSSVSYGRIAFITIQTNYSKQEITNALSTSWGEMSEHPGSSATKKLSISLDTTLSHIGTDSDTTINCYVYGGSSGQTVTIGDDARGTLNNIFNTFNGGGDGALPISYTMRHLNGELAKVQDASEYTIKHVTYNPKKLMDWSFLDTLIKNGTLFNSDEITLDFSAMIDYSNPDEADVNANRAVTIPDNVKQLTIIGPNKGAENVEYNQLSFIIDYRAPDNDLIIRLDSISFNANSGIGNGVCISSPYDALLTLDIVRRVNLTSSEGSSVIECKNLKVIGNGILNCKSASYDSTKDYSNIDKLLPIINVENNMEIAMVGDLNVFGADSFKGIDAGSAISAKTLLATKGRLTASGGNGVDGSDGVDGSNGKNGAAGNYGSPGTDGTDGTDGQSGTNGGNAIAVDNIKCDSNFLFKLNGGNGGAGGNGGNGGNGGEGGHSGSSESWTGGAGGNGGNGGNGGEAGEAGYALKCKNIEGLLTGTFTAGKLGKAGNGGNGGAGGNGGDGWGNYIVGYPCGGDGGNGGDAGNAGNFYLSKNAISIDVDYSNDDLIIENQILNDYYSIGGTGGTGGKGGSKGTNKWGTTGTDGNNGQAGKNGTNGIDLNN